MEPTEDDDTLYGTDASDSIDGLAGHDLIKGYQLDDTLLGADGDDTIIGDGTYVVEGGGMRDAAGNDQLFGGAGDDALYGNIGDDRLEGGVGDDYLDDDLAYLEPPSRGVDTMLGGAGADVIVSRFGPDQIDGGAGVDLLVLGIFHSFDTGGTPINIDLSDPSRVTTLGDGTTFVNIERIDVRGGAAADTIIGRGHSDTIYGSDGDYISGRAGEDELSGQAGSVTILGGAGDDAIRASVSGGLINGGAGVDSLTLSVNQNTDIRANFSNPFVQFADGTIVRGIEQISFGGGDGDDQIIGTSLNDSLYGSSGSDTLTGRDGDDLLVGDRETGPGSGAAQDDVLFGGAGSDTLIGGGGSDMLSGGRGEDHFVYGANALENEGAAPPQDTIDGFQRGQDLIDLSDLPIEGLDGEFTFVGSAAFQNAGEVRFEAAGGGGVDVLINTDGDLDAELLIHITNGGALTEADFLL